MMLIHKLWHLYDADSEDCGLQMMLIHKLWHLYADIMLYVNDADSHAVSIV